MKKTVILFIIIVICFVFIRSMTIVKYNKMIDKHENITKCYADIESLYQRRYDIINKIANIVKGYAKHENITLNRIVESRTLANKETFDKLMVLVENYPELKANKNFLLLQKQLAKTEDILATSRKKYNISVKKYNIYIRQFPVNIYAGFFGFSKIGFLTRTE